MLLCPPPPPPPHPYPPTDLCHFPSVDKIEIKCNNVVDMIDRMM